MGAAHRDAMLCNVIAFRVMTIAQLSLPFC